MGTMAGGQGVVQRALSLVHEALVPPSKTRMSS